MSKNEVFWALFENAILDFGEIWLKVAEYGLSSSEANLYVRKKSRSQDNPLNPLENNRIKKTIGF